MANIKISELNELTAIENDDILPIVDTSAIETKKISINNLKNNFLSNVYGTSNENGYTQNYINGLQTYSTTEQRIGTWIDGKPLYRITITGTLSDTNNTWKDFPLFTADYVDNIISMIGMVKMGANNNAFWSIPFTRATDSSYSNREYVYMNYNKSTANFSIIAYHPSYYTDILKGKTFFATLEYTKTAD